MVLEALAFLIVKYAFFHVSWHLFYQIFNQNLCRYITKCLFSEQNILVTLQMKMSRGKIRGLNYSVELICIFYK